MKMNVLRQFGGAAALAGATFAAQAVTLAASTMDAGTDGWLAVNGARDFHWEPAGYVTAGDFNGNELWFFAAPAPFRGDIGAAYGGTLSFSLMSAGASLQPLARYADVQILGANGVLLAFSGTFLPTAQWADYTVPIVAGGGWSIGSILGPAAGAADMQAVLADVRQLRIRGDYFQAIEMTALDNVRLSSGPVPEPATAVLALVGLAGLGAWARRIGIRPGTARAA
jgi:MYXO-CTERM domain-containing protein